MRQKKWKDCPVCGCRNSMVFKKNLVQTIEQNDYPRLTAKSLKGYQCAKCKESLLTIPECRRIDRLVGAHKAKTDSLRTVAADLIDVSEARKILRVSRQRLHQMMDEGKIPYVFINDLRIPIRKNLRHLHALS